MSLGDDVKKENSPGKLLVVDDDQDVLLLISDILRTEGYEVDATTDSEEALLKLPDGYDMLLTDQQMPGVDGLSLIGHVRVYFPWIACILFTGHATDPKVVQAKNEGTRVFYKPFDVPTVLDWVAYGVSVARIRRMAMQSE